MAVIDLPLFHHFERPNRRTQPKKGRADVLRRRRDRKVMSFWEFFLYGCSCNKSLELVLPDQQFPSWLRSAMAFPATIEMDYRNSFIDVWTRDIPHDLPWSILVLEASTATRIRRVRVTKLVMCDPALLEYFEISAASTIGVTLLNIKMLASYSNSIASFCYKQHPCGCQTRQLDRKALPWTTLRFTDNFRHCVSYLTQSGLSTVRCSRKMGSWCSYSRRSCSHAEWHQRCVRFYKERNALLPWE